MQQQTSERKAEDQDIFVIMHELIFFVKMAMKENIFRELKYRVEMFIYNVLDYINCPFISLHIAVLSLLLGLAKWY